MTKFLRQFYHFSTFVSIPFTDNCGRTLLKWNIQKILEKIEISRKGAILSLVGIFLFLVTYKLLPKTYATFESNIRYWIIWDILLCAICGIKIQLAEKWNGYFAFFMIVFSPLVSFGCIEKGVGNKISSMQTLVIALNYLICLTIYLLIYFFLTV